MTTRSYYVPRNQIGRYIMNTVVDRVGCSVEDFKPSVSSDTIRFTITCRDKDIPTVEQILKIYDILER